LNICVFAAASNDIDPAYIALGEAFGAEMGRRGHTMIFGAGCNGLMGAAARGIARYNGNFVGVVPSFFNRPGVLADCTETIFTETLNERKTIMETRADAYVALPGGVGTMEEIFEVITLKHLRRENKPIAFLDTKGYWRPAVELLRQAVDRGFTKAELLQKFGYFEDPVLCLDYLENEKIAAD